MRLSPLDDWQACGALICMVEHYAAYERMLIANPNGFGEHLRSHLLAGGALHSVVAATRGGEAPLIDSIPKNENFERPGFTSPFNVTGSPAISVCTGFGVKDLPVAMQIVGKPFGEACVFRIAAF